MDRDLCVLRVFIVMFEKGIYDSALEIKHIYLAKTIYREGINTNFDQENAIMNYSQDIGRT